MLACSRFFALIVAVVGAIACSPTATDAGNALPNATQSTGGAGASAVAGSSTTPPPGGAGASTVAGAENGGSGAVATTPDPVAGGGVTSSSGGAAPQAGATAIAGMAGAAAGNDPNAGTGGTQPAGGADSGGEGGAAVAGMGGAADGGTSAGGDTGAGGSAPAAPSCPADASFCSGFEDAGLPAGSAYQPEYQAEMWQDFLGFDTEVVHSGSQSLMVKPADGDGYFHRMLSVAAPGPTFWARVFIRSSIDIGQPDHNAYFLASSGGGDPNEGDAMEIAEQYCRIVLNFNDEVVNSLGATSASCDGTGALVPAETWVCMEALFDGASGDVLVYVDGEEIINQPAWKQVSYQTFRFGFLQFHGPPRTVWFDDVAVAPERIGCQ